MPCCKGLYRHTADLHPARRWGVGSVAQIALLHGVAPTMTELRLLHIFQISQRDKRCTFRVTVHHPYIHSSERNAPPLLHSFRLAFRGIGNSSYHTILPSFPFFPPQSLNHHVAFRTSPCSQRRCQRHTKAMRLGPVQPLPAREPYVRCTKLDG